MGVSRAATLAVNDATYAAWNGLMMIEDVALTDMAGLLLAPLGIA